MLDGCTPWPEDTAVRYRAAGYWRGESLSALLRQWAERYGARIAVVQGPRTLSYAGLDRRVDRMAAGFRLHGIQAGDRVVIQLPNVTEFVITAFALLRAGAAPVFSSVSHRLHEIQHLCMVSGASGYVVPGTYRGFDHASLATEVLAAADSVRKVFVLDGEVPDDERFVPLNDVDDRPRAFPDLDPSDAAFFLLSGGTTALPKLIPRTHDDYEYQTRAAAELLGLTEDAVYLAALPLEFNFTWGCPGVLGTLRSGGRVVLADAPVAEDCFALIEHERVTITSVVPTVAMLWLEAAKWSDADLSALRVLQIGGAPLHRETAERITPVLGCRLQQVFGMAEGLLSLNRDLDQVDSVLTTQGHPLSAADEIRIVDGELLVRGPYTLRGYYRAPLYNKHAFTDEGFFRTGDQARLTQANELVIEGRIKDVIIRGGDKVSADEVEGLLLAHPAVYQAAVVPVPDSYLGERIFAYVVPNGEPPDLATLKRALRQRGVANYKLPDRLEVVDRLPLTGLGKIDKKMLATRARKDCDQW